MLFHQPLAVALVLVSLVMSTALSSTGDSNTMKRDQKTRYRNADNQKVTFNVCVQMCELHVVEYDKRPVFLNVVFGSGQSWDFTKDVGTNWVAPNSYTCYEIQDSYFSGGVMKVLITVRSSEGSWFPSNITVHIPDYDESYVCDWKQQCSHGGWDGVGCYPRPCYIKYQHPPREIECTLSGSS